MNGGTMGWWYWFGMQIFGITSIVLTWWLFLDAFRRQGSASRFIWPAIALAGLLMQTPAFAVASNSQKTGAGDTAALAGVVGLIVVMLATITHFYRSPSAGGSGWSLRTRDENSASRSSADRRRTRSPQASVAVGNGDPRRSPKAGPPSDLTTRAVATSRAAASTSPLPEVTPFLSPVSSAVASRLRAEPVVSTAAPSASLRAQATADTTVVEDALDPTIMDEQEPTLMQEPPEAEEPDATLCDEVALTIVDEPVAAGDAESAEGPRLVITDGRSSRIIITERSGAFVVGRDPSKCSLAVDDARASRAHFSITEHEGLYYIQDMGSANGTFVNGALVTDSQRLSDADTVEFGRTVASFELAKQ